MKHRGLLLSLAFCAAILSASAQYTQRWYQAGVKISMNVPLNRGYATDLELTTLRNMHFNGYFRAGKYVFGEVGLGYHFFKGTYLFPDNSSSLLETRHLTIPVKLVGDVRLSKSVSFLPQVGVIYQPLLKCAGDLRTFNKNMVENHWTLLTAGFDIRLGFIILGVDYRYSFQEYFRNMSGKKPQFVNICIGAQF